MDGKQAATVVREYFEGISGICPAVFQTYSITRVDAGYEVICIHGAMYRGLVGMDGKLVRIERVDGHLKLWQDEQIREHCETIGGLRATISELEGRDARKTTAIDELQKTIEEMKSKVEPPNLAVMVLLHNLNAKTEALEAELSARRADSRVLMQVVEALREWQADPLNPRHMIERMRHIVEDYIDAPEIPDRKETGAITDQVIDKALDMIVSNMFNETAGAMQTAIADQDKRIKYLDVQIDKKSAFISSLLRNDKRLNRLLDERRADVRDRDRRIEELTQTLVKYRKENNDVWYTLNKIASIVKTPIREDKP